MGAFHSTKISGNSGSKSHGTESFRKFVSKISVNLPRLSFFLEIWKFRKFPVPFGISTRTTRYDLSPSSPSREFCLDQSYKMVASRNYTGCKIICHSSSLFLIAYPPQKHDVWEIVAWSLRISCGSVCPVCIYSLSRQKLTSFSHHTKMMFESVR